MRIGDTLLFTWLGDWLADPSRLPNRFDIVHYPLLFVGYLTLFFTALNLLPIGQLDGGHVTYGLFGARAAGAISRLAVLVLVVYGGIGLVRYSDFHYDWLYLGIGYLAFLIYIGWKVVGEFNVIALVLLIAGTVLLQQGLQNLFPSLQPNLLWLFYSFLAVQVIGLDHPAADNEEPLDWKRKAIGWLCIVIFVICFTPQPLVFEFAELTSGVISHVGQ
jgi:membrane-associated protease RseP (regulator of RpoE activity)